MSVQSQAVIVYHGHCADGIAALWACHQFFDRGCRELARYPGSTWDTQEQIAELFTGSEVYCVDICPPVEWLLATSKVAKSIVVLDHHESNKTIPEQLAAAGHCENVSFIIDITKAGCQLAWEYFFGTEEELPWFLSYVADRDLWRFALQDSAAVNCAMSHFGCTDSVAGYDHLAAATNSALTIRKFALDGALILATRQTIVDAAARSAVATKIVIDGMARDAWLVQNVPTLQSDIGNALCSRPLPSGQLPSFVVMYTYNPKQSEFWLSMRGADRIDLTQVARTMDPRGGGHFNAAGATVSADRFSSLFQVTRS